MCLLTTTHTGSKYMAEKIASGIYVIPSLDSTFGEPHVLNPTLIFFVISFTTTRIEAESLSSHEIPAAGCERTHRRRRLRNVLIECLSN